METMSLSDKQMNEICENVGQTLVAELDSDEVWSKVEQTVSEYLKNNNINQDAAELSNKLEWSVKVKLK